MSIDVLSEWRSKLAELPLVADSSWTSNFANWVGQRINGKAELDGVITANSPFTFDIGTFDTELSKLLPTSSQSEAADGFGNAWEVAMNSSTILNVIPGDSVEPTSPATTWSIVNSATIDSSSISSAKGFLISELSSAPAVDDVNNSVFPQIFRDTFLLLTGTIEGLNSSSPTPQPFIASNIPLI